jgi:peroxiredoxin
MMLALALLVSSAGCASSDGASPAEAPEGESAELPEDVEAGEPAEPGEPSEAGESSDDSESSEAGASEPSPRELGLIVVEEEVGAPDFTLPTLEGPDITLSDLKGTCVVLNFWSTGCPPCVAEMGYFEVVGREHSGELEIVAVDIGESASRVSEFLGGGETSFTVALDESARVARTYGIRYTPTTIFIDAKGNIPYAKVGAFARQGQLEDSVALLLEQ